MNIDLDAPDPSDRTIQRLELVEAFGEFFPRWRDGWPVGWLDLGAGPAGALLAEAIGAGGRQEATALPWREDWVYRLVRPREVRECWVRVLPRRPLARPVDYAVEAMVLTVPVEADEGVRCWQVLTEAGRPVMLTDAGGGAPRPWLLRGDCVYDLDHDIEHGWRVWARDEDVATTSGAPRLHRQD